MKDIRNCKECGRLFQYDGISKLCYRCRKKDDEDFRKVKDYIYEHPKSTIHEVADETEVSRDKILRYLREGRLEIVGDNPGLILDCEMCGKPIRTGRYCNECATNMERGFKSGFATSGIHKKRRIQTDKEKMHIAQLKKRR